MCSGRVSAPDRLYLKPGPREPGPPSDSLWTASAVEDLDVGLGCGLPRTGNSSTGQCRPVGLALSAVDDQIRALCLIL